MPLMDGHSEHSVNVGEKEKLSPEEEKCLPQNQTADRRLQT